MEKGMQALFPVSLPRMQEGMDINEYNKQIAQNENVLNQNFQLLYQKLIEIEESMSV